MMTPREHSVIDVHSHFVSKEFLEAGVNTRNPFDISVNAISDGSYGFVAHYWPEGYRPLSVFRSEHFDWPTRLSLMDERGIDTQVVSSMQSLQYYSAPLDISELACRIHNNDLAAAMKTYPGRIVGLASVPLGSVDSAIAELSRAVGLGLKGVQVLTHIAGMNLNHPGLEPFWHFVNENRIPVFIHPFSALGADRLTENYIANTVGFPTELAVAGASLTLGGVLEKYPNLTVVLGHGGGAFPYLAHRMTHAYNKRPEVREHSTTSPVELLRRIYVDTISHSDTVLEYLIKTMGVDRLVLGTDHDWDMEDVAVLDRVRRLVADKQHVAEILGGNAKRVFGL